MTATVRGACPECGRMIALTKDGSIRKHGSADKRVWPPVDCAGSWKKPGESK